MRMVQESSKKNVPKYHGLIVFDRSSFIRPHFEEVGCEVPMDNNYVQLQGLDTWLLKNRIGRVGWSVFGWTFEAGRPVEAWCGLLGQVDGSLLGPKLKSVQTAASVAWFKTWSTPSWKVENPEFWGRIQKVYQIKVRWETLFFQLKPGNATSPFDFRSIRQQQTCLRPEFTPNGYFHFHIFHGTFSTGQTFHNQTVGISFVWGTPTGLAGCFHCTPAALQLFGQEKLKRCFVGPGICNELMLPVFYWNISAWFSARFNKGGKVWANTTALLGVGWGATHAAAAGVASSLVPAETAPWETQILMKSWAFEVVLCRDTVCRYFPSRLLYEKFPVNLFAGQRLLLQLQPRLQPKPTETIRFGMVWICDDMPWFAEFSPSLQIWRQISQEEAVRRSWVLLGAVGFLGVSETQVIQCELWILTGTLICTCQPFFNLYLHIEFEC